MSRVLWTLQALLAATFLFAGGFKLLTPADLLATYIPLPEAIVRFIGSAECLGALGVVLPALLRVVPGLTPLAASGLVVIMTGATVLTPTFFGQDILESVLPLVLGVLAAFVAYGRTRLAPIQPPARQTRKYAQT